MKAENITIGAAKALAKKNDLQGCMILAVFDGQVKAVSYGADRAKCRELGRLVDATVGMIESGEVPLHAFPDDNAAEAAWQAHQDALAESGPPDDSTYRRTMIVAAGRGHLLR